MIVLMQVYEYVTLNSALGLTDNIMIFGADFPPVRLSQSLSFFPDINDQTPTLISKMRATS